MPFFGSDITSLIHPSFTEITSLHILGKIESKFLLGEFFPIRISMHSQSSEYLERRIVKSQVFL
jgi:hypothetical protein